MRLHAVALLEAIDAPAGVDELLLAGVEGMALGSDFDFQLALDGAGLESLTAGAPDDTLTVSGMDVFLHVCHPFLCHAKFADAAIFYKSQRLVLYQESVHPSTTHVAAFP